MLSIRRHGRGAVSNTHWEFFQETAVRTVRADNRLLNRIVDFLTKVLMHGGVFIFLHCWDSCLWQFPVVVSFGGMATVLHSVVQWQDAASKQHKLAVMHNIPLLQKLLGSQTLFDNSGDGSLVHPKFVQVISEALRGGMTSMLDLQMPSGNTDRVLWILNCLRNSTRGMSRSGISLAASTLVLWIVDTMRAGKELAHLRGLSHFVDFKGSEVRLESGTILEGAHQSVPYPAVALKWTCVQSYAWGQTQHINVLEILAFFKYLKFATSRGGLHGPRLFHVSDRVFLRNRKKTLEQ